MIDMEAHKYLIFGSWASGVSGRLSPVGAFCVRVQQNLGRLPGVRHLRYPKRGKVRLCIIYLAECGEKIGDGKGKDV